MASNTKTPRVENLTLDERAFSTVTEEGIHLFVHRVVPENTEK